MAQLSPLGIVAVEVARQGLFVFPLRPNEKTPFKGSKGFLDATNDVEKVREEWTKHPNANIGICPGLSDLVVLDFDGPIGMENGRKLGLLDIPTRTVVTGRPDGGQHRYLRIPPGCRIGNVKIGDKIDVRAHNGYVVYPPSIHPSGAQYRFLDPDVPIADAPPRLLELLGAAPKKKSEIETADRASQDELIAQGGRNNALISLAGSLRNRGLSAETIHEMLVVANERACDPPLPDREVAAIAKSISRYPAGPARHHATFASEEQLVNLWNGRYAVVPVGGKAQVIEDVDGEYAYYSIESFRRLYEPVLVWMKVRGQKTLKPATDVWLRSQRRMQYKKVVFAPGEKTSPDVLNLFRGFAVDPGPGDCSLFLDHLRRVVCNDDETHLRWVVSWIADLFQNPSKKIGAALVLRGKQGAGKTIIGRAIGRLLGPYYRIVSDGRHITGHFNRHLEICLLLQAEEAFWAGDKAAEGTLKHLITSDKMLIERKGVDAYEAANYTRLLVTSNAPWVVPAGLEERRFTVLDVSDAHLRDFAYFAAIENQLENGGYAALLQFLLDWKYDRNILRQPLKTAALEHQKIHSLTPEEGWLLDLLENAMLPGDQAGIGRTPANALRQSYIRHARDTGRSHRSIETQLGIFLKKAIPDITSRWEVHFEGTDERKGRLMFFPPLSECRDSFRLYLGVEHLLRENPGAEWVADTALAPGSDFPEA